MKKGAYKRMKIMKKILWNKENSSKGFTLVELIVVLVIMAILAAITVPVLTGWIDRAKEKQASVHARTIYLAAQTVVTEDYAVLDAETFSAEYDGTLIVTNDSEDEDSPAGQIARLADIKEDYTAEIVVENGTVSGLIYTPESGEAIALGDVQTEE